MKTTEIKYNHTYNPTHATFENNGSLERGNIWISGLANQDF